MRRISVIMVVLVLAGGAAAQPVVPGYSIETYAQLNGPQMLAIEDASCTLYVGNIAQSGAIYRIPEAGVVEAYGPALSDPDAVICAEGLFSQVSDRVLVGGQGPTYIKAILPDQSIEYVFPPAGGLPPVAFSNPTDMAFDSNDRLVFTDINLGAVYASNSPDPADNPSRLCTPGGRPVNIVIDSSDNIYVTMQYWGTVRKYDAAGTLLDPAFGSGLLVDSPASTVPIALGPGGIWGTKLYAIGNRKLIMIDMGTGHVEDIGSGFDSAAYGDMAFGPDGALYISDIVGDAILRIIPEPAPLEVSADIKPGSWPNPLNPISDGVLPLAICGSDEFDVMTIDPETILVGSALGPIRWSYEDVATPFEGEPCEGHDLNGDGFMDLSLKFSTQELVSVLGLDLLAGQTVPLALSGALTDGTPLTGSDCVWVLTPGDGNMDGLDYVAWSNNYYEGDYPGAAVPEPGALALLALGGLALLRRKRGYGG